MAAAVAATPAQAIPPNQSIYIQNLPEKLQKEDLRRALYMLFSTHGAVLDVTALKTSKMRGQAHVLFRDVQAATQAMRSCQGLDFFGREMKISYSKNRSVTLQKLTGNFAPPNPAVAGQSRAAAQPPSGFPAPPGTLPGPPNGLPSRPPGLPMKPADGEVAAAKLEEQVQQDAAASAGVKRPREESDDEAPMDEDDEEGDMEMSEDDD